MVRPVSEGFSSCLGSMMVEASIVLVSQDKTPGDDFEIAVEDML